MPEKPPENVGRVVFRNRGFYRVICANETIATSIKGAMLHRADASIDLPVVGDWVKISKVDAGGAVIYDICKRRNTISRVAFGRTSEEIPIAANADYLLICMSLNKDFKMSRLERFLFSFSLQGAQSVLILTKADLYNNPKDVAEVVRIAYPSLAVHCTSMFEGYEDVLQYFSSGKTSVLAGSSGVGKSTLVNKIAGREAMRTSCVSLHSGKGRHTTTSSEIIFLGDGFGCVVDTPGVQETTAFLPELNQEVFHDIEQLSHKCKYRNCTHTFEDGCLILECLQNGQISKQHYESYKKLIGEAEFMKGRLDYTSNRNRRLKIFEREEKRRNSRR
ncbi:MAG: ribosome small subunit-dependent GTPase A [Clostridiales bacterium]|jgi:ribosome biogenesis GTPase|nr:ribosome small subunit-dependent GTPase A [Clostridiales bacterium]